MMPIGVPRVPYRTPREGGWQWVDIWNCLVRRPRVCDKYKPWHAPLTLVACVPDSLAGIRRTGASRYLCHCLMGIPRQPRKPLACTGAVLP